MHTIRRRSSARVIVLLSALAAIGIILGKFLAFNLTEFMRFSLENLTIIFSGIIFGPLLGAAIGAVQDLVGCLAVGYAINPIITLGSALIGLVSGWIFSLLDRLPLPYRLTLTVIPAHLIGSVLVKSLGLSVFYSLPFLVTVGWRTLNYLIVGTLEVILLLIILKSKRILSEINKITQFSISTKIKTVGEASAFAKGVSGVFSKPGLERVEHLLSRLSSPESALKVVHVTGTNGKGSFCAMLSSVLKCSGLKVGTFTSPYLEKMSESIRIDTVPISDEDLVRLFDRLRSIADGMEDKPTEFELLTAAAYLAFSEAGVDVAVVECGMGAMRDATNVVPSPILSVITGVALDHTSFLGDTLTEIAYHKSGVIKQGSPLLIGSLQAEAENVIRARADELCAPVHVRGDYTVHSATVDGTLMDACGVIGIHLPLLGIYQCENAALVTTAAKLLSERYPTVTDESIRLGIASARWNGRFEILRRDPLIIYDGAHNLDGIIRATESVKAYFSDKVIIFTGVLADKDYEAMASRIADVASLAVTVTPNNPRALSATDYAECLKGHGVTSLSADSVKDGLSKAIREARLYGAPIICLGSLYMYGEVTAALKELLD